jgi:hypothetical protein
MDVRRLAISWASVEPARGDWNWAPFDTELAAMRRAGLRPLIVAIGSPCWARPSTACTRGGGPPDPGFIGAWSAYVRALTRRYPQAIGIEIWNEENSAAMFPPAPDPRRYTALLKAAYSAVKQVAPRMPVVSGGLLPAARSGGFALADWQFLAGMYAAGAGGSFDAIGAHPYPRSQSEPGGPVRYNLATAEQILQRLRRVRDAAGYPRTPIWVTETGVSTTTAAGFPPALTGPQQAAFLVALVRELRSDADVRMLIVHRLIDTQPVPVTAEVTNARAAIESGFGVYGWNGAPKPAACALSALFDGTLRC